MCASSLYQFSHSRDLVCSWKIWICWVDRERIFENSDIPEKTEKFMNPKHCKACSSRFFSWNLDMFWIICNYRYLLSIFHDVPFSISCYVMLCKLTTMSHVSIPQDNDHLKLIDFGFAKFWDRSRNMTQAGQGGAGVVGAADSGYLKIGKSHAVEKMILNKIEDMPYIRISRNLIEIRFWLVFH